jgi:hypothetical protein
MADEDDLDARKERAAAIRAQISNIVGPRRGEGGKGTNADSGQGKALPRKAPNLRPPSPREFVERRKRELDSAAGIEPRDSPKDKTPRT